MECYCGSGQRLINHVPTPLFITIVTKPLQANKTRVPDSSYHACSHPPSPMRQIERVADGRPDKYRVHDQPRPQDPPRVCHTEGETPP
jgi:hypothetical protein